MECQTRKPSENEKGTKPEIHHERRKLWKKPWRKAKTKKTAHHVTITVKPNEPSTSTGEDNIIPLQNLPVISKFSSLSSAAVSAYATSAAVASVLAAGIFYSPPPVQRDGSDTNVPRKQSAVSLKIPPETRLKTLEEEAVSAALAAAAATAAAAAERARIAAQAAIAIQAEQEMEAAKALEEARMAKASAVDEDKESGTKTVHIIGSSLLSKRRRPGKTRGHRGQQNTPDSSSQKDQGMPIHPRPPPAMVSPRFAARLVELVSNAAPVPVLQYPPKATQSKRVSLSRVKGNRSSPPSSSVNTSQQSTTRTPSTIQKTSRPSTTHPPPPPNSQPQPNASVTQKPPPTATSTQPVNSPPKPNFPVTSDPAPTSQPKPYVQSAPPSRPLTNSQPPAPLATQPSTFTTAPSTAVPPPPLPPHSANSPAKMSVPLSYAPIISTPTSLHPPTSQYSTNSSNTTSTYQSTTQPAPPPPFTSPSYNTPPPSHAYATLPRKNTSLPPASNVNTPSIQGYPPYATPVASNQPTVAHVTLAMLPNIASNQNWGQKVAESIKLPPRITTQRPSSARQSVGEQLRSLARNLNRNSVSAAALDRLKPTETSVAWNTTKLAAPADDPGPICNDAILPPSDLTDNESALYSLQYQTNAPSQQTTGYSNRPPSSGFSERNNMEIEKQELPWQKQEVDLWQQQNGNTWQHQEMYNLNVVMGNPITTGQTSQTAYEVNQSGSLASLPQPYTPTDNMAAGWYFSGTPGSLPSSINTSNAIYDKSNSTTTSLVPRSNIPSSPPQSLTLPMTSPWLSSPRFPPWNQTFDNKDRARIDVNQPMDNSIKSNFQDTLYQPPYQPTFDAGLYQQQLLQQQQLVQQQLAQHQQLVQQQQHYPETVVEEASAEDPQ